MQKANEEIASFLESIPEWGDYVDTELKQINDIWTKPLGQNGESKRKNTTQHEDDIFVMNFLNRFNYNKDDDDGDNHDPHELQHSDSFERSGRRDPDEEILGVSGAQEVNQVRERQQYRTQHRLEGGAEEEYKTIEFDTIDVDADDMEGTAQDLFEHGTQA